MSTGTTAVIMTKERAGEILFAVTVQVIKEEGVVSQEEKAKIINDAREDLAKLGISKEEATSFSLFIINEANRS